MSKCCFKLSFGSVFRSRFSLSVIFESCNFSKNVLIAWESYLGFTFSSDQKDDNDILRQLRMLYTKSNRLLRLFHHCSVDVKLALFRSYCACFYCPFLWTHYKKSNYSKLRVAFNNVYRRILKLPSRSSASTMYVVNNIDSLEVLVRKRIFGFTIK